MSDNSDKERKEYTNAIQQIVTEIENITKTLHYTKSSYANDGRIICIFKF